MIFPILIKTEDATRPQASIYYEVASNGTFQVRNFPTYRAVTEAAGEIPGLLPQKETLEIKFPRVPSALLEEVLVFFAEVYRRYQAEAIVILFYHPSLKGFRVKVPPQTIKLYQDFRGRWRAHLELKYGSVDRPSGFLKLGTIHSHAHLPAYASSTDCKDERFEDGLHIVFGDFDEPTTSRSATFVANGVRFRMDPSEVMESSSVPDRVAQLDWMASLQVKRRLPPSAYWSSMGCSPSEETEITPDELDSGNGDDRL